MHIDLRHEVFCITHTPLLLACPRRMAEEAQVSSGRDLSADVFACSERSLHYPTCKVCSRPETECRTVNCHYSDRASVLMA